MNNNINNNIITLNIEVIGIDHGWSHIKTVTSVFQRQSKKTHHQHFLRMF